MTLAALPALLVGAEPAASALADPLMQTRFGRDLVEWYKFALLGVGGLILLVAWLPLALRRMPLSLPIFCVGAGMALFLFTPLNAYSPHPIDTPMIIEKATEFIVIVSLMGAGLKIGRPMSRSQWRIPIRLLAICMPLTIVAIALGGWAMLELSLAGALLLGACLAPTDPVLAGDVQIEKPGSEDDGEARFALTSEAGFNDALAFPFVHLAIVASIAGIGWASLGEWVAIDVGWRLFAGLVAGLCAGRLLGWIVYRLPSSTQLSRTGDGFVALGSTFAIYAATEFIMGYGFLAVFIAGLILRRTSEGHEFNHQLHNFADETERLAMMAMLVLFGGMLAGGGLLGNVEWRHIALAALVLLVIRPCIAWASLAGTQIKGLERFIISFFGIRGLGSVFYLSYAFNHGEFGEQLPLWETVGLIILGSILLHGIAVTPLMRRLESRQ